MKSACRSDTITDMDWTFVTGALSVVGGLAVGTAKDLVSRHFQRKDKDSDRQATREDAHQADLRTAYNEFVAAYSRYLSVGGGMTSKAGAGREQRQAGYGK